jgi:peptidyl-prolyl cis-trans isomerase C
MMKRYLVFLLLLLPLFACGKKDDGKAIATLDGEKITLQEFNAELDKIPVNMKMLVASQSGKKDFLNRLIERKILLREAKKEKIDKEKEFQDRLAEIREQLEMQSLLKKKVGTEVKLTDADLEKYYNEHREEFKRDREIQTRQIVVKTEQEAREIQARIAKGENFADLARRFSLDPAAKNTGGDIGYHPKGTLIPEYEAAAFQLTKVGEVSPPVKTQLGYHIIKLEGMRTGSYVPFPEVKDFIRQKLTQTKQAEVLQKYVEDLKKKSKITVNEELLKEETRGQAPATGQNAPAAPGAAPAPGADKPAPDKAGAEKPVSQQPATGTAQTGTGPAK